MQNKFRDLITARQRFLLTGHENPDGDCLGAQVALLHLLRTLGKEAAIVNPDPIGRTHDFLLRHTPFQHARASEPLPPFEVAVLLDCSQLSRLGELGPRLRRSGAVIAVIDHHVGSEHGDGEVCYVDATAAATGVLVRRLYAEFDLPLSPAAAEGVFLSLVSDTGWFRHSNTDAGVLRLAAELVDAGVDASRFYDRLHRRMHPESAALLAQGLARHELRLGGRLALVCLDREIMDRMNRADFDSDGLIDTLRSLDGIEVVAVIKERFDGSVKLSMRSKADVDVQQIAASFGGGGHRKAAGASVAMSLREAAAAVEERVRAAVEGRA